MKAVMCTAFEGPEALEIGVLPDPDPAPDEVLVAVEAASVSFMDLLMISGGYQMRPDLPYVPGTDAAGVAVAVGAEVDHIAPGDRVIGTAWHGAYAERMAVKGWRCNVLPEGVDMVAGSTVAHTYATAHYALKLRAGLQPGEWCLVTGASGGVGLAAVDYARMLGARVIACVSSRDKAAVVRDYGAEAVIVLDEDDLRTRVKEITGGHGIDVCFEMVGGDTFLTLARVMAWNGRIMPIGFAGGEIPKLPMNLPLLKNYSVVGVFIGAWNDYDPDPARRAVDEVLTHVANGDLTPKVDRVLPMGQAQDAMALLQDRSVQGRVVLEVG